ILQPFSGRAETELESIVRAVHNRFVTFKGFEDRGRVPVVCSLITERKTRWIVRMTGHFHVVLTGHRDNLLQEMGDALPVVIRTHPLGLADRETLPIVLELECGIRGSASARCAPVATDGNHSPVIGDD